MGPEVKGWGFAISSSSFSSIDSLPPKPKPNGEVAAIVSNLGGELGTPVDDCVAGIAGTGVDSPKSVADFGVKYNDFEVNGE